MVVQNVRLDSSKNKTKTGVNCSQEEPESTGQAWGVPEIQWIQETGGKKERKGGRMRRVTRVSAGGAASANSTLQLLLDPESSKEDACQKGMLPFFQIPMNQWWPTVSQEYISKAWAARGSRISGIQAQIQQKGSLPHPPILWDQVISCLDRPTSKRNKQIDITAFSPLKESVCTAGSR